MRAQALIGTLLLALASLAHASVIVPTSGLPEGDPRVKATLTLQLVMVRNAGWDEALAASHVEKIAGVYAQCGLRIDRAVLTEIDPPGGRVRFVKWEPKAPGGIAELVAANPVKERPVFYLFQGYDDADWDDAFSRADFTLQDPAHPVDPAFYDSVFLPSGVNAPAFAEARKASPYSVAAHELWHVLTREGSHYNEEPRNLSNIWRTRADLILPRDCALILANPLVRPLH